MTIEGEPGHQAGGSSPAETQYASSYEEADRRSRKYRNTDPFPLIPRALLSSEHIQAYVRETGMIYPFESRSGSLKSASYEVRSWGPIYILGRRRKEDRPAYRAARDIHIAAQLNQLRSDRA